MLFFVNFCPSKMYEIETSTNVFTPQHYSDRLSTSIRFKI